MQQAVSMLADIQADHLSRGTLSRKQAKSILLIQKGNPLSIRSLQGKHYSCNTIYGLKNGLSQAVASIPNLIIIACKAIGKDDMESVKQLKMNVLTQHIPIIILVSKLTNMEQIACLKVGVDVVCSYPIDERVLEAQVTALLRSRDHLKTIFQQDTHLIDKIDVEDLDQLFMNRARQVVIDNISNSSFSIGEFVRLMQVSRTLLYVKIKALTGQSTSEFVREIRLKEAAKLLKEGVCNVSQVAFKVGFCDPKYLSKKFKEKFGISPSIFQKGTL